MKEKIVKYKNHTIVGVTTVLSLGLIVAVAFLFTTISKLNDDLVTLRGTVDTQNNALRKLAGDVDTINAENGTALGVCLDTAAKTYSNTLKATGKIEANSGGTTTIHTLEQWNSANNRLLTDRDACNIKYNKNVKH